MSVLPQCKNLLSTECFPLSVGREDGSGGRRAAVLCRAVLY